MRQAIETKYLGPTNNRGARVKAMAQAGSVIVPWDHSLNVEDNHTVAAYTLAKKYGWVCEWEGGANAKGTGNVYVAVEVTRGAIRADK